MPCNSQHDLRVTTGRHRRYDLADFYIFQQRPLELQIMIWRFFIQNDITSLGQYTDYSMTRRFNLQGAPADRRQDIQFAGLEITAVSMNIMMQNRIDRQVALECCIEWIEKCFSGGAQWERSYFETSSKPVGSQSKGRYLPSSTRVRTAILVPRAQQCCTRARQILPEYQTKSPQRKVFHFIWYNCLSSWFPF